MTINPISLHARGLHQSGLAIALLIALSGCATTNSNQDLDATEFEPVSTRADGSVRGETKDKTVARLWASAENARRSENDTAALQIIYEALELDPKNAILWSRAAEIQLDGLQAQLAESYATKSNAFADDNSTLQYRNWLIIKHARDMQGDLLGARSASKMVQQFKYE